MSDITMPAHLTRDWNDTPLLNSGILTDAEIRRLNFIHPFSEKVQGPCIISYGLGSLGYDLRLGPHFLLNKYDRTSFLDPLQGRSGAKAPDIEAAVWLNKYVDDTLLLYPGESVLAETMEELVMPPDVIGICIGKSTYARCFVLVNATPIEPGWRGKVTLEITNIGKTWTRLYVGMGICQILFFRSATLPEQAYLGKYQDQPGVTPAR